MKNSQYSVLVMDSDVTVLTLVSAVLESSNIRCLLAQSFEDAIDLAARAYIPIDLVLTDSSVQDNSGEELMKRLRVLRPNVKVLYMSAGYDGEVLRLCAAANSANSEYTANPNLLQAVQGALTAERAQAFGQSPY